MFHIYTHDSGLKHDTGAGHPERIDRLITLHALFETAPFKNIPVLMAREAAWEEIARAHNEDYMTKLQDVIPDDGHAYIDSDTVISPGSWDAAVHAAGAVCQAVDDVMAEEITRAFCAVRPPGHHAFPDHPEGFCLFNNVMVGALHAANAHNIDKVAVLDFDVHHGNGSDFIARLHDNIFYGSTHQWPIYPGTGLPENDIEARIINRTLSANDGSQEFRRAWQEILKELDSFAPDLIFISAGFDAHKNDPLAQINLTEDDFGWITDEIVKTAATHCNGRIVSTLEGGYDLDSLKKSTARHLTTLFEI